MTSPQKPQKIKNATITRFTKRWNAFMLRREFEFEINQSPQHIVETIEAFHIPAMYASGERRWDVRIKEHLPQQSYTFHFANVQRNRRMLSEVTSVYMRGSVVYSSGYKLTIVRGFVRLGWVYLTFFTLPLALIIAGFISTIGGSNLGEIVMTLIVASAIVAAYVIFALNTVKDDYVDTTQKVLGAITEWAVTSLEDVTVTDESPFRSE